MPLTANLPLGVQLNNPVHETGTNGVFCLFKSVPYGFRAAELNLMTYADKLGLNTPRQIINTWAPPADHNDTSVYLANVCDWSGWQPDEIIAPKTYNDAYSLLHSMTVQEQGSFDLYFKKWQLDEGLKRAGVVDVPLTPLAKNMKVIGSGASTVIVATGGVGQLVKEHAPGVTQAITATLGHWPQAPVIATGIVGIASGLAFLAALRDHFRNSGT